MQVDDYAEVDRRAVDPPIEVESATWSPGGTLDWWVKERREWWGRVGVLRGVRDGSSSRSSSGGGVGRHVIGPESRDWQPTEPGHLIVALAVVRIVRAADRMREAYVLRDGLSGSAFSKGAAGPVASDR